MILDLYTITRANGRIFDGVIPSLQSVCEKAEKRFLKCRAGIKYMNDCSIIEERRKTGILNIASEI
jgi:hypothetical protein